MIFLLALHKCNPKVINGIASSLDAWKQKGQFISKFCFHGESDNLVVIPISGLLYALDKRALFKYTISKPSQGKLYFYLDETWEYAQAEQDCAKKMAMAKLNSEIFYNNSLQ